MTKATHNGTCQCCGRQQAVRISTARLAKHGYTKELGFFNGTCMGADELPLEKDAKILDLTVKQLTERAATLKTATEENITTITVQYYDSAKKWARSQYTSRTFNKDEWAAWIAPGGEGPSHGYGKQWGKMAPDEIRRRHHIADNMTDHVKALKHLKAERHGKELIKR